MLAQTFPQQTPQIMTIPHIWPQVLINMPKNINSNNKSYYSQLNKTNKSINMKSNLQTYDLPQNDQTEKASREDSIKTNNEPSLINQIITSSTGETESLFEEFNDHYDPNELCDFSFGNCDEFFDYSTSY